MAEDQAGTPAGTEDIPAHVAGGNGALSVREAARSLSDWRNKQNASEAPPKEPVSQPERARVAPAADESADAETGSPDGETTDEGQEQAPDSETPTIEPPPSWTEEALARWSKLDPETQEYIANRDREDKAAIKRKFQEAEEQGKKQLEGLTAREQAMEQARLQYESLAQASLQALQSQLQGEFSDIQTMDDVKRLANEDWARYLRWDAHQKDIAAKMTTVREANERQANETKTKFAKFADDEDKKFIQRVPEFADKEKAAELQGRAIETLKNVGFTDEELGRYWNGQESFSFRDSRQQELIHKAALWDRAQEAKKVVSQKPLPPVQRPGVAQQGKPNLHSQIQTIQKQLHSATGMQAIRLGAQLTRLQRESGSR